MDYFSHTLTSTAGTTTGSARDHFLFSPELIGCVALSVVLLVTLTVNCVVCLRKNRRRGTATRCLISRISLISLISLIRCIYERVTVDDGWILPVVFFPATPAWVTQHRDEHPDTSLNDYREALSGAKMAPARSPGEQGSGEGLLPSVVRG